MNYIPAVLSNHLPVPVLQFGPLTPEWLTKCGFEKVPINKVGTWSIKVNDRWILEIVEFADGYRIEPFWYSYAIQYVHQLQNLFYIFCGGELNIEIK